MIPETLSLLMVLIVVSIIALWAWRNDREEARRALSLVAKARAWANGGSGYADIADWVRLGIEDNESHDLRIALESDPEVRSEPGTNRLYKGGVQVWPRPVPRDPDRPGRGTAATDRIGRGRR